MRHFFDATVRPFFLVTGAGTALIALYALAPAFAMERLAKLPYLREYTIIIQHWGIMVGLMGACMMAAALRPEWRVPIFAYSGVEKAFMVWLVLRNAAQPWVAGFWIPLVLDSLVVLYTIGWFASRRAAEVPMSASTRQ